MGAGRSELSDKLDKQMHLFPGLSSRQRSWPTAVLARVVGLGVLAWACWWIEDSLAHWSRYRWCAYVAGPYLPCGPGPEAWMKPLILALLPLAFVGLWGVVRLMFRVRTTK